MTEPPYNRTMILKKGSPILLDADLLYTEEELYIKNREYYEKIFLELNDSLWKKFHIRYNEEHRIQTSCYKPSGFYM